MVPKMPRLELDSFDLKLYGVKYFFLSDSQNVFIFPIESAIGSKKGDGLCFFRKGTCRNIRFLCTCRSILIMISLNWICRWLTR